jgi:biopolymer transport protein ExbD
MSGSISRGCLLFLSICAVPTWLACSAKEDAAKPPSGPIVGLLELPVSLRTSGAAPADAAEVEISPTELHVAGQPVLMLTGGLVAAADRQGTELPKLSAALKTPAHSRIALSASSEVPYETVALVLATVKAVGMRGVAFKVRPPGGSTTTGFLSLDDFTIGPKTKSDEEVVQQGVAPRPWGEFVTHWEEVQNGCQRAQSGSCAFKPTTIAEGGNLKIVLVAAGLGANVNFSQVGAPPPAAAPKKPKVELLDGVKKTDIVKDVEEAPPASDASFQFRAQEVLKSPSPISDVLKPICGTTACGVVVSAEKSTMFVRVASLLGAAFPDNTPAPVVAFELP